MAEATPITKESARNRSSSHQIVSETRNDRKSTENKKKVYLSGEINLEVDLLML